MCWSGEASTAVAAIGVAATAYALVKKEPPAIWATFGYFTLMEILQATAYLTIDDCADPANQIVALLGYLHIAFQPFFINAFSLLFVPKPVREKVAPWVFGLCFAATILMLIQLYPFAWAGSCETNLPLCGPQLCTASGNWHIAWDIPYNGLAEFVIGYPVIGNTGLPAYALASFWLPALYGSWRFTIFHFMAGPALAQMLTDNSNEWPAVWCLFSIGLIIIVVIPPVRRLMHVQSWPLWPRRWLTDSTARTAGRGDCV